MSSMRVIHVSEMCDYPDAVYVGRAIPRRKFARSKWANPYRVGENHREEAIGLFRDYLVNQPELIRQLPELSGKTLACWCRRSHQARTPETACHADVLIELLDTYSHEELLAWGTSPQVEREPSVSASGGIQPHEDL